jgi:hypothetical protein
MSGNDDDQGSFWSPRQGDVARTGNAIRNLLGLNAPGTTVARNMEASFREASVEERDQETTAERTQGPTEVTGTPAVSTGTRKNPRVGGIIDGVVWVGGSNVPGLTRKEPADILAFRPTSFKELYRQNTLLKDLET